MIRLCNDCWYLFEAGSASRCPDCGSKDVRPADADEIREYYRSAEPAEDAPVFSLSALFIPKRNRVPVLCGLRGIRFAD